MHDAFGRRINYVRLSVTDRCNLRCTYCMAEDMQFMPRRDLLTFDEIERLALHLVGRGVKRIRLTGGEIAKAGLLGTDYWLYVIEQCNDGAGTLFAAYQDPASTFAGLTQDLPIFKIKGSDLKAHQTKADAA